MTDKKDIRKLSLDQLTKEIVSLGERSFRANQIFDWIWKKRAISFGQMTNLSESLREKLSQIYEFRAVKLSDAQISNDRTIKNAFALFDNAIIEGVLIPTPTVLTVILVLPYSKPSLFFELSIATFTLSKFKNGLPSPIKTWLVIFFCVDQSFI